MPDELVFYDPEGGGAIMKYPLYVTHGADGCINIADASHKIVCAVLDREWGHVFAKEIVSWANRWHYVRCWFRPYTGAKWLNGRSTIGTRT